MRKQWITAAMLVAAMATLAGGGYANEGTAAVLDAPFSTVVLTGKLDYPGEADWYEMDVTAAEATVYLLVRSEEETAGWRALVVDGEGDYLASGVDRIVDAAVEDGALRVRIDNVDSDVGAYSVLVSLGAEIESNDGVAEGNDLGTLAGSELVVGSLLPAGDADVFRFELPVAEPMEAQALLLETSGGEDGDTVIVVYRFDAEADRYLPIGYDDDGGDGYWSRMMLRAVPGGRYAVRVTETAFPLEGVDRYALTVRTLQLEQDEEPNDIPAEALDLSASGSPPGSWTANGVVDGEDRVDHYAILVEAPALLVARIGAQPGADRPAVSLELLLQEEGDEMAIAAEAVGTPAARIAVPVEAGGYILRVAADPEDTALAAYRLVAEARPIQRQAEQEPNDTAGAAQPLMPIEGETLWVEAAIEPDADADWFRLRLENDVTIVAETGPSTDGGESGDTTLTIYDGQLTEVAYNDDADSSWSRIETTLRAGEYYLVVEGFFEEDVFDYVLLLTLR